MNKTFFFLLFLIKIRLVLKDLKYIEHLVLLELIENQVLIELVLIELLELINLLLLLSQKEL